AVPPTTNPVTVSAIHTPYNGAVRKVVNDVHLSIVLSDSEQISVPKAQRAGQNDPKHARMGYNDRASAGVSPYDFDQRALHSPLESRKIFASRDPLSREALLPSACRSRKTFGDLSP